MKYCLQISKSFQETEISFPKCIKHQLVLNTQLQPLGFFEYHCTNQSLILRKRYADKCVDAALVG